MPKRNPVRNAGLGMRGRTFETEILSAASIYRARHIAVIYKMPIPTGWKGNKMYYREKTGFDFIGTHFVYLNDVKVARSVYFEAKDFETKGTLPICGPNSKDHGVQFHQLTELTTLEQEGCEAFILWRVNNQVYRLSPNQIWHDIGVGHSVTLNDRHLLTPVSYAAGILDFLLTSPRKPQG